MRKLPGKGGPQLETLPFQKSQGACIFSPRPGAAVRPSTASLRLRPLFPVRTPPPDCEPPQSDSAPHPPASLPDAPDQKLLVDKPTEAATLGRPCFPGNPLDALRRLGLFPSDPSSKAAS